MRLLTFLTLIFLCSGFHYSYAQPSKSYKKQMKQKAKAGKGSEDLMAEAMTASKVLKKYKDKLTALGKDYQDAEASGDPVEVAKIEAKQRAVKGEMFRARDKIEKKMIKNYQKINDRQTRKRMKKNKKKSGKINTGKKPSIWKRMFN